jgi:hypothetical protein
MSTCMINHHRHEIQRKSEMDDFMLAEFRSSCLNFIVRVLPSRKTAGVAQWLSHRRGKRARMRIMNRVNVHESDRRSEWR